MVSGSLYWSLAGCYQTNFEITGCCVCLSVVFLLLVQLGVAVLLLGGNLL